MVNFMKKTLRGIAAIVASAMVTSALGAVNVFATDLTPDSGLTSNSNGGYNTEVSLGAYASTGASETFTSTATWKITIDSQALKWKVNYNSGVTTLTWNGTSYARSGNAQAGYGFDQTNGGDNYNSTTQNFDKKVTLTNKCNFDVNINAVTTNKAGVEFPSDYDNSNTQNFFELVKTEGVGTSNNYSLTSSTPSTDIYIRPNIYAINSYLNNAGKTDFDEKSRTDNTDVLNLGKATLTFTKNGNLYQYNSNPVGDTSGSNNS
jgi:hypothetical protein